MIAIPTPCVVKRNEKHIGIFQYLGRAWYYLKKVWNFELFSIEDKPFTAGRVLFVIVFFILGIQIARRTSRFIGKTLLPRLGVSPGVALALQTLSFYLLILLFVLLILNTFNVPLTIFTFLGGALAIGIGFGSQNIVNNFISGLIILIERPVKPGDMIEVDANYGTVERIGARSTSIRGFNNVHMILPNSDFLEKKVINWNLSDDLVRVFVSVGVAYGSPTRDVSRLMKKAVDEHGLVIKNPEPVVLFTEFGDNALLFEIHFWIRMRVLMDRRKIESDIRFRIDSLFREAGITIAFPQRDIHIDTLKPLELKWAETEHEIKSEEQSSGLKDEKESQKLKERLHKKHGHRLKDKQEKKEESDPTEKTI